MILSLGIILLSGFVIGYLLNKIKIPGLVGMILLGLLFGPYCLNIIDSSLLDISSQLRQIALVIILTRSGLNLDIDSLKKIGRPAILMCFVPAVFEITGIMLSGHYLLDLSWIEGLLLGSVLAAVSPAVVSPRMIKLIEDGYGNEKNIPKLVLAGASVDDIFVIVLFYGFLGAAKTNTFDVYNLFMIPTSIILGVLLGIGFGFLISLIFKYFKFNKAISLLIVLAISFIMLGIEELLKPWIAVSALLGIIVMAIIILFRNKEKAKELSASYNSLWQFFEIILFVLVGATLDLSMVAESGLLALAVMLIGLAFRSVGVCLCLIKTDLSLKERAFVVISYLPKATVQASIGGIALSNGLTCGSLILAVSIITILVTAPIGAFLIDFLGKKLLKLEDSY